MHSTLAELLENLKSGMLWVSRDGVVRYANGEGGSRTGLAAGQRLYDPDMARTVSAVVAGRAARAVTALGAPAQLGGAIPELKCRVIPGLSADDAFVLIGRDPAMDGGAAFENLMRVIRHDMHEPLQTARDRLGAAGQGEGRDGLLEPLEEILALLGKLVDLAEMWGSSALLANDRIEIWPLLQSVWAEAQPVAQARSLKVRFHANAAAESLATIYGSEPWLRRVFSECLSSALRASRPGATLNIEHVQMGPRALIVFRDCGVFAPRNAGSVELPTGPARPVQRLDGPDQIGLKLCQHIVSLHGGQLREEKEDGACNFLIDLPTGAPHRTDHTQIDIAQAQHYARDLAALMARSRGKRPTAGEAEQPAKN
ncbi:MAG: sensor histidine kinase [Rhizobacter sp.]